jgi:hypothetical protein
MPVNAGISFVEAAKTPILFFSANQVQRAVWTGDWPLSQAFVPDCRLCGRCIAKQTAWVIGGCPNKVLTQTTAAGPISHRHRHATQNERGAVCRNPSSLSGSCQLCLAPRPATSWLRWTPLVYSDSRIVLLVDCVQASLCLWL